MTKVTNAILLFNLAQDDDERLAEVNTFFTDEDSECRQKGFVHVNDASPDGLGGWYGGSKFLEVHVAIGAFNYLPLDDLITHLRTNVQWDKVGACVQLVVQEQEDEAFRVIDVFRW